MNQWTDAARRMLDECLNRNRTRFAAEGAEADEVAADLRRHVESEVSQERLQVVTVSDVRRLLARVDPELIEPDAPRPQPEAPRAQPEPPSRRRDPSPGPTFGQRLSESALWLLGVLLPLGTLLAEYFSGMCADAFFDPLPTVLNVILVAVVPVANAAALLSLRRTDEVPPRWLGWLLAFGIGVSAAYAVAFLPLAPFGFIGLVFFGFGALPLSPLFALIVGGILHRRLKARARERGEPPAPFRWLGAAGALLLLAGPVVPTVLTQGWLRDATDSDPAKQTHAIQMLRRFGHEQQVLRAAYGRFSRGLLELGATRPCTPAQAQETYFRMTGRPYNSMPPPQSSLLGRNATARDEFEWDESLGGEAVAGRVTGLSLQSSRLDASAHPVDGWGYTEWTLEFRNDHPRREREARALLQLPPGGVVSRVTLWIHGEEREAAFAGRGAARAAYQEVAVVQRRDPILVTTAGPDRVLMQCFPIPTNGGVMKVRVGISAPLPVLGTDSRAFLWPRIIERNFGVHEDVRHNAWLELFAGTVDPAEGWSQEGGRATVVRASVPERNAAADLRSLRLNTGGAQDPAWALDDRGTPPAWIRQRVESNVLRTPGRLALVVDAGRGADRWFPEVRQALQRSSGTEEVAVWLVHDGANRLEAGSGTGFPELARQMTEWKIPFDGGHDPAAALLEALEWSGSRPQGTVVWIHGPMPVASREDGALRQWLERAGVGVRLVEISAADGPNRLLEKLDGVPHLEVFPRVGTLAQDLGRFLDQWSGRTPAFQSHMERILEAPAGAARGSRHIVRLWAAREVERLRLTRHPEDAVQLAARWQLVTPVSGAVVLETQAQFARHGLSPVDPFSAPMVVPEPSTWALMILGSTLLVWTGARSRRSRCGTGIDGGRV